MFFVFIFKLVGDGIKRAIATHRFRRSIVLMARRSVLTCIPMAAQQLSADLHPDGGAAGQC
jgi:hypothetical protein